MANETESKTYVFGNDSNSIMPWMMSMLQQKGIDPNVLLMNNGGMGGNNWFVWLMFLWMFSGNGNNWNNGANGFVQNQLANDTGRELIIQAVNGNQNAINQLANSMNVSVSSIQGTLNALNMNLQNVGSQVGMSSQAIINAIQAGNCQLANQFAQCCCENKLLLTQANYENQIATLNQTNQLGSQADRNNNAVLQAIANQTTVINDKFCDLEMRELRDKITALTADKVKLEGEISVLHQNAYINQQIAASTATLAADIAALKAASGTTTTNS